MTEQSKIETVKDFKVDNSNIFRVNTPEELMRFEADGRILFRIDGEMRELIADRDITGAFCQVMFSHKGFAAAHDLRKAIKEIKDRDLLLATLEQIEKEHSFLQHDYLVYKQPWEEKDECLKPKTE